MREKIFLIGAGGHGNVVLDLLRLLPQYEVVGLLDENTALHGKVVAGVPVLGAPATELGLLLAGGVRRTHIAFWNTAKGLERWRLYQKLVDMGFQLPPLVHPSAVVASTARLGDGTCVLAGAVVNANALVGESCILNTRCVVEHDCSLGTNVHIAPGAVLGGGVRTGNDCLVGLNATVLPRVRLGKYVRVGAGAVVTRDVRDGLTVSGVPARTHRDEE
jgi:UDP-perosamine 4-acetyltransferase